MNVAIFSSFVFPASSLKDSLSFFFLNISSSFLYTSFIFCFYSSSKSNHYLFQCNFLKSRQGCAYYKFRYFFIQFYALLNIMLFFFLSKQNGIKAPYIFMQKNFRFYSKKKRCGKKNFTRYEKICFFQSSNTFKEFFR